MTKNEKKECAFLFYEGYWNVIRRLPSKRKQCDVAGALVEAFFTGKSQCSRFKGETLTTYMQLEERMFFSRTKALAGQKGGLSKGSSKPEAEQEANSEANQQAKPKQTPKPKTTTTEKELLDVDVYTELQVIGGDEIVSEPEGFAHFMAECVRLYNAATGQAYSFPDARARQGMLEIFRAGRTIEDVERVMADVKSWPRNYQTLDGVFADGKFEKHINRQDEWGGEHRDWSVYNDLVV